MALYEQVSAQIYSILLRYAAPEDILVYSVGMGICAEGVHEEYGFYQVNLFVDYEKPEREKRLQVMSPSRCTPHSLSHRWTYR